MLNTTMRKMGIFFYFWILAFGDKTGDISFIEHYSIDLIFNQVLVTGIKIGLYSSISHAQEKESTANLKDRFHFPAIYGPRYREWRCSQMDISSLQMRKMYVPWQFSSVHRTLEGQMGMKVACMRERERKGEREREATWEERREVNPFRCDQDCGGVPR